MINILQRTIGVNFSNDQIAEIQVWAPFAEKVELKLEEKDELVPLRKGEQGYWMRKTGRVVPGDTYSLIIDDEKRLPDPASLCQPHGVHGVSKAIDLRAMEWNETDWQNHLLDDYIIYELHIGTFTDQGTFKAAEEKLDYLLELGITAIEIMPVAQFPGERNWGYDGVFPFAVQYSYGAAQGLKDFVEACHNKGIAVILDVVYNHMGPEGNYLGEFGPYFTDKYKTPWGEAINFDDAWSDAVRAFFIDNALMWLRDFRIDALRLDAVHAIKDFSTKHILQELKEYVDDLMVETERVHYLIVELDLNDSRFITPLKEKGFGMDAQWIDEFHHALRVTAGEENRGYYADFNGIKHLAKAYQDAYVYDGQYSPHRKKTFGNKVKHIPGKRFVVFSQNHDQVGNRMLGERSSQLYSFEMQKLLAASVILSPYQPMLFMGEEWGEKNPFLYFVDHSDSELAEAVRKGRREEFAAFDSGAEVPDPLNIETFQQSKLQWGLHQTGNHLILVDYYKELIQLRKRLSAFSVLDRDTMEVYVDEAAETLVLVRWQGILKVCCLLNFSKNKQRISLPSTWNEWLKILDSADTKWGGEDGAPERMISSAPVDIQPESILVYINGYV